LDISRLCKHVDKFYFYFLRHKRGYEGIIGDRYF
jgi:hypothetical protein